MNKKHFYAAVIILSFLVAGIQPALAINIPTDPNVGSWNVQTRIYTLTQDVTEGLNIVEDNLTLDGDGHTVTPVHPDEGVDFYQRSGITIMNLNVTGGGAGISLRYSNDCTVTNNTVSTCDYGIWIAGSSNNTVTGNTVESGPTSNAGIHIQYSDNITLTGNNVSGFDAGQYSSGIYLNYTKESDLTNNTVSNNSYGIRLYHTYSNLPSDQGHTLTNNTVLDNTYGIELSSYIYTTLTGNIVSQNTNQGIRIIGPGDISGNNTLTNNTISYNNTGIRLLDSSDNEIYNNSFIANTTYQAYVTNSTDNSFDYNYWSDWCPPEHPDGDGDGIVDEPYEFTGGIDNYPLAPTPEQALGKLIIKVEDINGEYGISNALDSKLENALAALEAKNAGQRQDAINKMQAFINAVEAQRDNKIPVDVADGLIADANYIISLF